MYPGISYQQSLERPGLARFRPVLLSWRHCFRAPFSVYTEMENKRFQIPSVDLYGMMSTEMIRGVRRMEEMLSNY